MIPDFDDNGNLPPGIHWANWLEFKARFGKTSKRREMIRGLQNAMEELKYAGCRTIYINGSFVTNKTEPRDFDACWDREDVDIDYLRKNDPALLNVYNSAAQKSKYKGEIFPSDQPVDDTISIDFFQRDREQNAKGIIAIDLLRWEP